MRQPCFITAVTYERAPVLADQSVVDVILANVDFYRKKYSYYLCGFVVMPDHLHFVIVVDDNALRNILRDMKSMIARQVIDSWKASPTGHAALAQIRLPQPGPKNHRWSLWQPGNWLVQMETAANIEMRLDYMHLNPARTGLVERATDWSWSSARWYLLDEPMGIQIDTDWAL